MSLLFNMHFCSGINKYFNFHKKALSVFFFFSVEYANNTSPFGQWKKDQKTCGAAQLLIMSNYKIQEISLSLHFKCAYFLLSVS